MEATKAESLSSLYLLRALLSKISKSKDECDALERETVKVCGRRFIPSTAKIPEGMDGELRALRAALTAGKREEAALREKIQREEARYERQDRPWTPRDLLGSLLFVFACTALVFFLIRWWVAAAFSFLVGLLAFPLSSVLLFLALITLAECGPTAYEKRLARGRTRIARDREALARLTEKGTTPEALHALLPSDASPELRRHIREEYAAFCETIRSEREELIRARNEILKEVAALYELTKAASVIGEEEWQELDVILCELESARAATLAEARHQADLYRRHHELRGMQVAATASVCAAIEADAVSLALRLEDPLAALRAAREQTGETAHLARTAELITRGELCQVLLEKAAVSSERLCLDLSDVKRLHERIFA